MKKVKIVSGIYGYHKPGAKRPDPKRAGDVIDLSNEEAARLTKLGVGVVIGDSPAESTVGAVATPVDSGDGVGTSEDTPDQGKASEGKNGGHLDPEQLKKLTNDQLGGLAKEMGIDSTKFKAKAELIAAIISADVTHNPLAEGNNDGDTPPDLGAEAPVV